MQKAGLHLERGILLWSKPEGARASRKEENRRGDVCWYWPFSTQGNLSVTRSSYSTKVSTHVDIPRQISPRSLDPFNPDLTSQNTLCADFQRYSSDFRCKCSRLINRRVDSSFQGSHLSLDLDFEFLGQVVLGDSGGDDSNEPRLIRQA